MKINNKEISFKQIFCLSIYYSILYYLPSSTMPIFGKISKHLRYLCCKQIFQFCGKNVNIERKAYFASGTELIIGENSGIGINCKVPGNIKIGKFVMMGPNCYILGQNHKFDNVKIPMMFQGSYERKQTVIEDDVWIGRSVYMTPGRYIKRGTIIGIGCVLTKDFPEYSIVGGNPSKLINRRINYE